MKKSSLLVTALFMVNIVAHSAQAATGADTQLQCQDRQNSIKQQIEITKSTESDNDLAGYQLALKELQDRCDIDNLTKQTQSDIAQLELQISQIQLETHAAETDLAKVLDEDNKDQIKTADKLLRKKQQLLTELQDKLEVTEAELGAFTGNYQ